MSKSEPPSQNEVSDGANNLNENNMVRPHFPSMVTSKRERTNSTSARALETPMQTGKVKVFCRTQGHGFIAPDNSGEDIFVHVSDIEGEYVPLPGDEVEYRLCPIPPKLDKSQAVHVRITNLTPEVHHRWSS